jgi:hypothetical protein
MNWADINFSRTQFIIHERCHGPEGLSLAPRCADQDSVMDRKPMEQTFLPGLQITPENCNSANYPYSLGDDAIGPFEVAVTGYSILPHS